MLLSRLDAGVQLLAVANRGFETGGGSRLIGLLGWRDHSILYANAPAPSWVSNVAGSIPFP